MTEPTASRMALLTKFSEAISSSPSAWRRASFLIAFAMSGSLSTRERCINGEVAFVIKQELYYVTVAPSVVVSNRGEQRIRAGHPWIYRADVVDVDASGGDIVSV